MGQRVGAGLAVQRKAVHAGASGDHHHVHRAEQRVARRHLRPPGCRKSAACGSVTPSGARSTGEERAYRLPTSRLPAPSSGIEHQHVAGPRGYSCGTMYRVPQ
jgi:hypothetical protein